MMQTIDVASPLLTQGNKPTQNFLRRALKSAFLQISFLIFFFNEHLK